MKRLLDLLIATIVLILLLPIILLIVGLIFLLNGSPVFFIQDRMGKMGNSFKMYKFRTMILGARNIGTGLFSYSDDPRITKFGKILRATSLDELPQLLNIIKGDMSLVGPRPPVIDELGEYDKFDDKLKMRFTVKPGVTGYSQVYGRNSLDWETKIEYDIKYINDFKNKGILLDLKLLFLTLINLFKFSSVPEKKENMLGKYERNIK